MLNGLSRRALTELRREVTTRLYAHDSVEGSDMWLTVRNCLIERGVSCPQFVPVKMRPWVSNACAGLAEFERALNRYYESIGRADKFEINRIERNELIRMVAEEYIRGKVEGEEDDEYTHPNAGQILQQFNQWKRIAALVNRVFPGYGLSILKSVLQGKQGSELLEGLKT